MVVWEQGYRRESRSEMALKLQMSSEQQIDPGQVPAGDVEGLYVHVPFCFHKCHYCDFYSITRQDEQRMGAFVDRVLREAELWAGTAVGRDWRPRTVFFGGGTPTLLPIGQMERLLRGLKQRIDFSRLEEWTVEANPATVTAEYAAMLRQWNVDRISFGAQSFDKRELALLERHHDPEDVLRSVEMARAAGFGRINLDLIYAIPGQSMESWAKSLEAVIATGVPHISCYALTYEPNTPMAVRKRLGQFEATSDEVEIEMFRWTRRRLREAGRAAYEVSNYAMPGEECRHNLVYWKGGNYLALGPSGASHVEGWRWKNRPHLGEWESAIDGGSLPAADVERLSPERRAGELAMLMLRLTEGLNFDEYAGRMGVDAREAYAEVAQRLVKHGLLEADNRGFRVPEGALHLVDAIAGEFLGAES